MGIRLDAAALFVGYLPPREDEEGITPKQQRERRESLYRATMIVYDSTMNTEAARYLAKKPISDVAHELDLDWDMARDVRGLARKHLERVEMLEAAR